MKRNACLMACAWLLGACVANAPSAARAPTLEARRPSREPQVIVAPQLRATMRQLRADLVRAGLSADPQAFAGFLPNGEHATFPLHVPSGGCRTLVAIATQGVGDVDAALYTPEGEVVAVDAEADPHPTLQVCAGEHARDLYYVIQVYDGDGSFLVLPFSGTRATLAAAARVMGRTPAFADLGRARARGEDPIASLQEGLRKRGFVPEGEPLAFDIAQGELVRTALPTQAGTCYTVAAFGSDSVRALGLRVRDDHGAEASLGEGQSNRSALQLCARRDVRYVIETEAKLGTGRVLLFVFRADVVVAGGENGLWLGQRENAKLRP